MHIKFSAIPRNRNRYLIIQKFSERAKQHRHLLSDFNQKLIDTKIYKRVSEYKVSWNTLH